MTVRVGINGFGRVGRYALRSILKRKDMDIVSINSRAESKVLAHLFKYDSIHGIYNADVTYDDDSIIVNGKKVFICRETNDLKCITWGQEGVDIVLECTGKFRKKGEMTGHLEGGAKKVILAARERAWMPRSFWVLTRTRMIRRPITLFPTHPARPTALPPSSRCLMIASGSRGA